MANGDGHKPLNRTEPATSIRNFVLTRVPAEEGLDLWPRELMPIDYRLSVEPEFQALLSQRGAAKTYPFRFWQVEALLDQAADLLDRAIRDRASYDALRSQEMRVWLEVTEFEKLDKIHQAEVAAGWDTIEADQSGPESTAESKLADAYAAAAKGQEQLIDTELNDKNLSRLQAESGSFAKANSCATYAAQDAVGRNPKGPFVLAGSSYGYDSGFNAQVTNGITRVDGRDKLDLVQEIAASQSKHNLTYEKATADIQRTQLQGLADAEAEKKLARSKKATWDAANVAFRRGRSESAIEINSLKRAAMTTAGGAFNYTEQKAPIALRFLRDFTDAYARLLAAEEGLFNIYNYNVHLPPLPNPAAPYASIFDDALIWTRDAIRFLVGFSHLEQSFTIPVSVQGAAGSQVWKAAIKDAIDNGKEEVVIRFDLSESFFPQVRALRLRGISAYTVSQSPIGPWRVAVRPPARAMIRYADTGNATQIDQQDVATVVSGRVMMRSSQREADAVGASALRNISPISDSKSGADERQWMVRLQSKALTGEQVAALSDLHLDLHLVARA